MSGGCMMRGVRGATLVSENTAEAILTETRRLVRLLMQANDIAECDIVSVLISCTPDLNAAFPALGVRQILTSAVPLFGCHEVPVPDAPEKCIRVLLHWNTDKKQGDIKSAYVNGTKQLLRQPPQYDPSIDDAWIASQLKELED